MRVLAQVSATFMREHLRTPLTRALLIAIPALFVLVFASVLAEFASALGGVLDVRAATSISAGWAAAFLSGTLAFFQVASSRAADRRLALAGLGAGRVAAARVAAGMGLGVTVSAVALLTLALRSGVGHPLHAAAAIAGFAAIYIGIGALIGAFVAGLLEGSLLVILVFSVDAFSGPQMTSGGGIGAWTPTRDAADVLVSAAGGGGSAGGDWLGMAAVAAGAILVALGAFWQAARARGAG